MQMMQAQQESMRVQQESMRVQQESMLAQQGQMQEMHQMLVDAADAQRATM
jgi:hypothetical protein